MYAIPKVVWNGTTFDFTIPSTLWVPKTKMIGGGDESAAGIPEVFEIRRDHLVSLSVRFFESQWPNVAAWLEWAQSNAGSFAFWFDKADAGTAHTCYLITPGPTEMIDPDRDSFVGAYRLALTLRRTTSVRFDVRATAR